MNFDKYKEMGPIDYWEQYYSEQVEQIKKLISEGTTDEELLKNDDFSRTNLRDAGVKPSYLIPRAESQILNDDWDYHIPNDGKWEFQNGIPFLDDGFSRDTLAMALITNMGLKRLVEILPEESKNELKKLLL
ncbi:hypothetical protein [Clostridium chrysemydis]|uniref:hypothetical protein n=1 Tax=Clostridium chrysemydis TaxID=2665504 RepID=UPI001883CC9D|nr:hypothetical protein [Clostridium chrysemydis]